MSSLLKSSLRLVLGRKLETLAVILVTLVAVLGSTSLAMVSENYGRVAYELYKASGGDLLLTGSFPAQVLEELRGQPFVEEVRAYRFTFAAARQGEELVTLPVIGHESFQQVFRPHALQGSLPRAKSEAVLYETQWAPEAPRLGHSGSVTLLAHSYVTGRVMREELRLVGNASGLYQIGGLPQVLVVHEALLQEITGNVYSYLAVDVRGEAREGARQVLEWMEGKGVRVAWYFVNTPEENAVARIVRGITSLFALPTLLLLISVPLISASVGSAFVARDFKLIGLMKALGAGPWELFQQYSLPWLIRGGIGMALALLLAPGAAENFYRSSFQEEELGRALYEGFGFQASSLILLSYGALTFLLILLGALVPFLLAMRVRPLEAVTFTGLYVERSFAVVPSTFRPSLLYFIREPLARYWKLLVLVLLLGSLMGLSASATMIRLGAEELASRAMDRAYMPMDAYVVLNAISPDERLQQKVEDVLRQLVGSYHLTLTGTFSGAIEGIGFVQLVASIGGDPRLEFPLLEGRYPRKGEAVVSLNVAKLRAVEVGDVLRFRDGLGREHNLKVVGISKALHLGGSYVLVSEDQYLEIRGASRSLTFGALAAALVLPQGRAAEEVKGALETSLPLQATVQAREAIARSIVDSTALVRGALGIVSILAIFISAVVVGAVMIGDHLARAKEVAVLKALGLPPAALSLSSLFLAVLATLSSLPLALLVGWLLAEGFARNLATFTPYISPKLTAEALLSPLLLLSLLLLYVTIALAVFVIARRINVARSLSDL
ncbi:MAG: ABC transporter permease [Acidilobaceae archaeon]